MHNIKLTIAYDGSGFHGWQIQPGQPTIQGVLSTVLRQLTQEQLTLHGAGRTDAGVHAWGQVANFKTQSSIAPQEFARALNALLSPEIRVRHAEEVGPDFHSRWLARAKTYQYRIYRGRVVPPFLWRYVLQEAGPLDFAAMAEATHLFVGEHDFSSFAASTGSEEEDRERTTRRSVFRAEILKAPALADGETLPDGFRSERTLAADAPAPSAQDGEEWIFLVRGQSFLRHMVRKMAGTLLEVGRGRLDPGDIPRLLALGDRTCSGPTAPPQGLCLLSVEYPDPISLDSLQTQPLGNRVL